jgi:hypothetical protein
MGEQSGMALCQRVGEELAKCNVNVIAVATDGDRSYDGYQKSIFQSYRTCLDRPLEDLSQFAAGSSFPQFWWVADPLHALKCQRCRLKNKLFIGHARIFSPIEARKIDG